MDYANQLNQIKEAQKKSAVADLEKTRNQALSDLEQEKTTNAANFNAQRNKTNIQNQLAAKNFKEYLVNSGRSNSGIMPQYEMNRQNNLQRNINEINSNQNMALADINRRNTLANQNYNSGLESANAQIEANYLNNLLDQQQLAWEREMQQKQFDEQVRQYNENMAFQKQQYADQLARKSLGRSSGGSSGRRSSGSKKASTKSTPTTYSKANGKIVVSSKTKQGGIVDNLVQAYKGSDGHTYYKDSNGKYVLYK
jgi:hypothetical protein